MTMGDTEVQRRYMTSVTASPLPHHWKSHALTDAVVLPEVPLMACAVMLAASVVSTEPISQGVILHVFRTKR